MQMRISIEYKDKKYTVVYGKLSGVGPTPQQAVEDLVGNFRKEVGRFFGVADSQ